MKNKNPKDLEYQGELVGLKGEVFELDGRVAGCIPPSGQPGVIRFEVLGEYPGQTPRWADMLVFTKDGEERWTRINPEICTRPFWRLLDCVYAAAMTPWKEFSLASAGQHTAMWFPPQPHPEACLFVFTRAFNGKLLLIDTHDRMELFSDGSMN